MALLYSAADRAVRDVFVDGRQVVGEGRVLTMDMGAIAERLREGQILMLADTPKHDHAGRADTAVSPLSLPLG
ncbi:MAG: hypothetical protein FJX51_01815 [Alphaproteobacteria bacterium]|nr:hypothetical protein [Alphaproteobacteria bacterium]